LIANRHRQGGSEAATRFFEDGFRKVFSNVREESSVEYPISVFYAFKQAESGEGGARAAAKS
jgi:putative DNA methylase